MRLTSDPVVCVARWGDGGQRDRLWAHVQAWWERELGWPVFPGERLSRAAGLNLAASLAGDWEVALFVDADVVLGDSRQAHRAAAEAVRRGQLAFAHNHWWGLTEEATERVLAGAAPDPSMSDWDGPNTFSSALAVPRVLWDAVGGFDERFVHWGFEDLAFWSSCWALGGRFQRIPGPVYHLWHPRKRELNEDSPGHADNETLGRRYLDAKHDRVAMLAIIAERP